MVILEMENNRRPEVPIWPFRNGRVHGSISRDVDAPSTLYENILVLERETLNFIRNLIQSLFSKF